MDDGIILKNGYTETGRNAFISFTNTIYYNDILDIEFCDKYEPICTSREKFFGKRINNCHYIVLTIKSEPSNVLLYISVENEIKLCEILQKKL